MAVIIQTVAGREKSKRFYPDISGVGRSYNYYSFGEIPASDGVVNLALGMGKTIVDGGKTWQYSPGYPNKIPPFQSAADVLKNTQLSFWSVRMDRIQESDPLQETEYMGRCDLKEAEYDNRLDYIASTYNAQSDTLVPGTGTSGPRVIDFAPLLQVGLLPFDGLMKSVMEWCKRAGKGDVEIEFALTFDPRDRGAHLLSLLQYRPMRSEETAEELAEVSRKGRSPVLRADRVLGHGVNREVRRILYVKPETFHFRHTPAIARQIEVLNGKMAEKGEEYLLIGFGRWGSFDPWLGIGVTWSMISSARGLVEVKHSGRSVDFSQGSHFFHNLVNLGIFYFYVSQDPPHVVNWEALASGPAIWENEYLRAVEFPDPLLIAVNGRENHGEVLS